MPTARPDRETARMKTERNEQIMVELLNGKSVPAVADKYELAERTVRDIRADWRRKDRTELAEEDPMDTVREKLALDRWLRGKLFDIAEGEGVSDGKRIAALRTIGDLRQREIDLLQEVGMLPRDLGQFTVELDLKYYSHRLIEIIRKYDVPLELDYEVLRLFGRNPEEIGLPPLPAANGKPDESG